MSMGIQMSEIIWHSIKRAISVICVMLVIGAMGWAVYVTFFKPHTNPTKTTSQNAEEIVNNYNEAKPVPFGCASMKVMQYYTGKENKK